MDRRFYSDELSGASAVSTGSLPANDFVQALVEEAYERYRSVDDGAVADYIPALARIPRNLFGICVVGTSGAVYSAGEADYEFSIQSVAKPFVFALVCQGRPSPARQPGDPEPTED